MSAATAPQPPQVRPYTVTIAYAGRPDQRLGIMALTRSDAIACAQELHPHGRIVSAILHPDWDDE